MKVIITRPSPDAEAFAAMIAAAGVEAVLSPVMAIRPRKAAIDLAGIGALAFTSANGVRAFAAQSAERALPVFAVGAVTAAAARDAGFAAVSIAAGDVESLAALIARSKPPSPLLHLAGSERAGDLIKSLGEKSVEARRAVIYDAVEIAEISAPAAAALDENAEDCVVVFFSPRSARLFARQAEKAGVSDRLARATALALSAPIADAAGEIQWARLEVAPERSAEAMASLVAAEFSARKGRMAKPR